MTSPNGPHSAESDAPTTDCGDCGRTAKDCNDSHAKGWDGCCMGCDGAGRNAAHRLRITQAPTSGHLCERDTPVLPGVRIGEVPAAPLVGQGTCVIPTGKDQP